MAFSRPARRAIWDERVYCVGKRQGQAQLFSVIALALAAMITHTKAYYAPLINSHSSSLPVSSGTPPSNPKLHSKALFGSTLPLPVAFFLPIFVMSSSSVCFGFILCWARWKRGMWCGLSESCISFSSLWFSLLGKLVFSCAFRFFLFWSFCFARTESACVIVWLELCMRIFYLRFAKKADFLAHFCFKRGEYSPHLAWFDSIVFTGRPCLRELPKLKNFKVFASTSFFLLGSSYWLLPSYQDRNQCIGRKSFFLLLWWCE